MQERQGGWSRGLDRTRRALTMPVFVVACAAGSGCGVGKSPPAPAACDQSWMDGIALRALRETMRFTFNGEIFGRDAGEQDAGTFCEKQGTVQITGNATSEPEVDQGATQVTLTYKFDNCLFVTNSATPERNYHMMMTGEVLEKGTLSAVSTTTTSLFIDGPAMTFSGTVYDPPIAYEAADCLVHMKQDGNGITGAVCGRDTSFGF